MKELRESYKHRAKIYSSEQKVVELIAESNELISIFVKSINTGI